MVINPKSVKLAASERLLTNELLAEKAGVSRQTITRLLQTGRCSRSTLKALSKALEVEPSELVRG